MEIASGERQVEDVLYYELFRVFQLETVQGSQGCRKLSIQASRAVREGTERTKATGHFVAVTVSTSIGSLHNLTFKGQTKANQLDPVDQIDQQSPKNGAWALVYMGILSNGYIYILAAALSYHHLQLSIKDYSGQFGGTGWNLIDYRRINGPPCPPARVYQTSYPPRKQKV